MESIVFETDRAPSPAGAYSQAKQRGNILALAGQVGIDPSSGALAEGLEAQAVLAFENLNAVLQSSGASFEDVVMIRVYLTEVSDFGAMNTVFAKYAPKSPPARTTVYVGLPEGMLIEIDAIAVVG